MVAYDSENNELLGTVALQYQGMKDSDPSSVWLTALYVRPCYRNFGIGTKLINFAIECSKTLKIQKLMLFTYGGGRIYEKLGFQIIETAIYNEKDSLVMSKVILS